MGYANPAFLRRQMIPDQPVLGLVEAGTVPDAWNSRKPKFHSPPYRSDWGHRSPPIIDHT